MKVIFTHYLRKDRFDSSFVANISIDIESKEMNARIIIGEKQKDGKVLPYCSNCNRANVMLRIEKDYATCHCGYQELTENYIRLDEISITTNKKIFDIAYDVLNSQRWESYDIGLYIPNEHEIKIKELEKELLLYKETKEFIDQAKSLADSEHSKN